MASGTVVCGTNVGIISDLKNCCCVAVEVKDYQKLASKVLKLVENKDHYLELQRKAYQWVKEHDLQWTAFRYHQAFQKLINVR